MLRHLFLASTLAALSITAASHAATVRSPSRKPHGATMLRLLGPHAHTTFAAPGRTTLGALVAIPPGKSAAQIGAVEIAPGIARVRGTTDELLRFADAHPDVHMEVVPPLRMLLDKAAAATNVVAARSLNAVDGAGVLVGVADTGLDVTHPDFIDESGHSRVAWILDLSLPPAGLHPDLEQKYGVADSSGTVSFGAVYSAADIDAIRAKNGVLPGDEVGHGTHVTGIAAGNGGTSPQTQFIGMAPKAQIVFARISGASADTFSEDDVIRGVQFLYDRAEAMGKPVAVNLSLGTDFGPHDGTMLWEQALSAMVGSDHPGRALVVAAGNSGSISETPIHDSVYVADGQVTKVPISTGGADADGGVQVWVTMRAGASMSVGLEGPDGEWIAPVDPGTSQGANKDGASAGVVNGANPKDSNDPIPQGSTGAVVVWTGKWPTGNYAVTLKGHGTADLYLQSTGDASLPGVRSVGFVGAVREGTVNLPATSPGLIAVGCTVTKPTWHGIDNPKATIALRVPNLDAVGGSPASGVHDLQDGEECWFSSAGPTVTGVPKPEISAPGAVIASSMAKQAAPGSPTSLFTNPSCPASGGVANPRCLQVDATHAVSAGTSMAAPMVTGTLALLLARDPTLTQDKLVALLQAGAHAFRGPWPFDDQGGPGELDAYGSLDAMAQLAHPEQLLPAADQSWLTVSADYVPADSSLPITAIFELRSKDGAHRADMFDASRLQAYARVDGNGGSPLSLTRRAPGVWFSTIQVPAGLGGHTLTIGATFDGNDIVAPKTVPIAADIWASEYETKVHGGCGSAPGRSGSGGSAAIALVAIALVIARRR
jgi:subtilisin family serine protease